VSREEIEQCGYRGISEHSVKVHVGHYHSKKQIVYCENGCGKKFTDRSGANYHMKRHCSLMNPDMREEAIKHEIESGKKDRKERTRIKNKARVKDLFKAHNLPI